MNKKSIIVTIVVGVILAGAGFFGGIKYQQHKTPTRNLANAFQGARAGQGQAGGAQGGAFFRNTGGGANRQAGQFIGGEVISKDDKSMTIKMPDGGSKIVFYSTSTMVSKMAQGNSGDVSVGTQVVVTGNNNSDGSVNAQSIQIRPANPQGTPPQN